MVEQARGAGKPRTVAGCLSTCGKRSGTPAAMTYCRARPSSNASTLPPATPVQIIQGGTYGQEHRPLHYIHVVAAGGRIEFAYRYGTVPEGCSHSGSVVGEGSGGRSRSICSTTRSTISSTLGVTTSTFVGCCWLRM